MNELLRDARHTVRRLARTPVFTIATLVTLGLGIGANTAIFSIINSVLLKPLPFPEPDRLIGVWQTAPGVNIEDLNASMADYVTYREESRTFADVAIWESDSVTVMERGEPERVEGMAVTFRLLSVLGVYPALGRDFTEQDNVKGNPEVAMLSHGYWQRRFGGDLKVVGRSILADGKAHEIIGVLPQGFWFMDQKHDIVTPVRFNRADVRLLGYNFQAVARLKPGVTIEQANADVRRMIGVEMTKFPSPKGFSMKLIEGARLAANVRPLIDDVLGDIGKTLWVVMATIGIVLLIACANVANLLLVRTEGRAQELAVRAALGAGRRRIARELLMESVALALVGGALGAGFAVAAVRLVLHLAPARMPRFEQISVDPAAMLFTIAISLAAGVALGAIPVLKYGGVRVSESLRAGGRTASASRERNVARNSLTVVQVALALVLLVGSGLMIRTFASMRRVQPGFREPATLQTLRITIPKSAAEKEAEIRMTHQNLVNRLTAIPGVTAVSLIGRLPMTGAGGQDPIYASDHSYAANQIPPLRRFHTVAPETFRILGTPMTAGREYTWTDIHEKREVVIIGENFAREYWGSAQAAIGKQLRTNPADPWSEVIGVAGDIRHDGAEKAAPSSVYWKMRAPDSMTYLVRGPRAGTESLNREIREAVWAVNRSLPITQVQTMQQVYDKSMARTAFTLVLLGLSGGMALLLAAVGIYAVISYTVAQKTREIGIRMALGARQGELRMMFVRHGVLWAGMGAAVGLGAAVALSGLMSTLLFEISPLDPVTYVAVAVGLLAAAALSSYVPARRVTRVNPVNALRAD